MKPVCCMKSENKLLSKQHEECTFDYLSNRFIYLMSLLKTALSNTQTAFIQNYSYIIDRMFTF